MATGLAIGVTVVGIAAIIALLGILARQLGFWAWIMNWFRATKEEKTKLCHPAQRIPTTTAGRPYLQLENDLDWINLWPRSGTYKRFSNLDDVNSEDARFASMLGPNMVPNPPIPPQPLRPAPGPPHRFPGFYDGRESSSFYFPGSRTIMGMMMGSREELGHHPNAIERDVLQRRESERSLNSRNIKNLFQDYQRDVLSSPLQHKISTNPFHSDQRIDHADLRYPSSHHYTNPFSNGYQYPTPRHFQAIEEENGINHTLVDDGLGYGSRSNQHLYTNNYDEYSRFQPITNHQSMDQDLKNIHTQGLQRTPEYNYNPERFQSSSQTAYNHSVMQALEKQRKLQQNLQEQLYRYDKMKQDEARIREEERILQQLRYENDMMRRERYENTFDLNGLNKNIYINEAQNLQREALRENLAYDYQRGASEIRGEMEKRQYIDRRHMFEMGRYSSHESRDSPPPPAPDPGSEDVSYPESPELSEKETYPDWREKKSRIESEGGRDSLEIPATPPNTASLTPPNLSSISSVEPPYPNALLQERLDQVENIRYKGDENDPDCNLRRNRDYRNLDELEDSDFAYSSAFTPHRDLGSELTQKLHALQEGKGLDIYPRALKERVEKRRDREGSRRKRKRDRDLERRSSGKQLVEVKSNEKIQVSNTLNQNEVESSCDNNAFKPQYKSGAEGYVEDNMQQESALNNVPIGLVRDRPIADKNRVDTLENIDYSTEVKDEPMNRLNIANVLNRDLGNSPVIPRKNFLSYQHSWDLETNSSDMNEDNEPNEDDENTVKVRSYIASLSASLQHLPDDDEEAKLIPSPSPPQTLTSTEVPITPPLSSTPPCSVIFPITPPSSCDRTNSQSSVDTPSSAAATWGSVHAWGTFSDTPPNSASLVGSARPSYSDTPPSSAGFSGPTPPNSAPYNISEATQQYPGSPPNSGGLNGSFDLGPTTPGGSSSSQSMLKRAASCDSVNSDTSVTIGQLEEATEGQITGYLSVQVIYDCETADLEVVVNEGRDLVGSDPNFPMDSYVRVFLLPDKSTNMQTRVAKKTNNPSYKEKFLFALEEDELLERSLVFYLYSSDKFTNTLIGEAQIKLAEVSLTSPLATELTLTDSGQRGIGYGEIMFSLSYLPTAERLTVVVVKARSLQFASRRPSGDTFVKVYILQNGKKIMKKKTSVKKGTDSPLFNEAMIFNVPAPSLHNIQLRLTVAEQPSDSCDTTQPVGHVIVGTQATGKALSHWNQMMSSLRKPIGMWHALRR